MTEGGGCECSSAAERAPGPVLWLALILNGGMFLIGIAAGLLAGSTALVADALDMLSDAFAYAVALLALARSARFKANAGLLSGSILTLLGLGLLVEVFRRSFGAEEPVGAVMLGIATVSLVVNSFVLHMLSKLRRDEAHMRATWIFTRADIVANLAVISSGLLVMLTGWRFIDLVVGAAIGLYVLKEATEILRSSLKARGAGAA